jgi:ribosomal protein L40E
MVQHTRTYEMATHTSGAQRRKGGASKGIEGLMELPMHMNIQDDNNSNVNNILQRVNHTNEPSSSGSAARSSLATVKRNKFGTGPFDEHWLNVDCCGLFCAGVTYILHLYGVYAINFILLPPWMSATDETGLRSLTWGGHFHRLAFTSTAVLAIYSHFKAMTTDPGAVPPDAQPLEEPPVRAVEAEEAQPPRKGKRLCRRCNAFKPKRAHHCSVCRRCVSLTFDCVFLFFSFIGYVGLDFTDFSCPIFVWQIIKMDHHCRKFIIAVLYHLFAIVVCFKFSQFLTSSSFLPNCLVI